MFKLKRTLRDFFFPTLQNQLRPYSLRYSTLIFILVFSLAVEFVLYLYINTVFRFNPFQTASVIEGFQSTIQTLLPEAIVNETNKVRLANSLPELKIDNTLKLSAQMKADDMRNRGYFSHIDPDGRQPWIWMDRVGYPYQYAGENLAINFYDTNDLIQAWLKSPSHKENLLNPNFEQTGIGITQGRYLGKETTFVVQFFASRVALEEMPNFAIVDTSKKTEEPKKVALIEPEEKTLGGDNEVVNATSAEPTSTTLAEVKVEPQEKISLPAVASLAITKRALVSPRYFVSDLMLILVLYVVLTLIFPMIIIFLNHRSPSLRLRVYEIFILFKKSIISAGVTLFSIGLMLLINHLLLGAKIKLPLEGFNYNK